MTEVGLAETYFTPKRIAYLLRHWREIRTMADTGSSSRGLLIPGPTPESPKVGARQPGYHGDSHSWSNVVADLERARAEALEGLSLEWYVVEAQMHGWSINKFAEKSGRGDETCLKAFNAACEKMAAWLGWVKEDHGEEPADR